MPLNFPSSPVLNQLYTFNGKTWKWDGAGWISYNIGLVGPSGSIGPIGITGATGFTGATGPVGDYVYYLNGLSGGLTLFGGNNISIFAGGKGLTISAIPGVTSLNGLTGAIVVNTGSGIASSTVGNTITLTNSGVTGINGQTGSAYAYGFHYGFTSTINLYSYPDGTTANTQDNQANWYGSPFFGAYQASTLPARANRIYFNHFHIPSTTGIQTLRFPCNTSTGSTGTFIFGIYDANSFGFPNNRVYTSGTNNMPAANTTVSVTPSGLTLNAGVYFMAVIFSSNPQIYGFGGTINQTTAIVPFGSKSLYTGYYNQTMASEGAGFTLPSNTSALSVRLIDFYQTTNLTSPVTEFRVK